MDLETIERKKKIGNKEKREKEIKQREIGRDRKKRKE